MLNSTRGNMTGIPKPTDLENFYTCKYDAWKRLVEVKDSQTVIARYEYDGLGRRVKAHIDSQTPGDPDGVDLTGTSATVPPGRSSRPEKRWVKTPAGGLEHRLGANARRGENVTPGRTSTYARPIYCTTAYRIFTHPS